MSWSSSGWGDSKGKWSEQVCRPCDQGGSGAAEQGPCGKGATSRSMEQRMHRPSVDSGSAPTATLIAAPSRSRSPSDRILDWQKISGEPKHFSFGNSRTYAREQMYGGHFNSADYQDRLRKIERKTKERTRNFHFSSRSCRKCQGLHRVYLMDDKQDIWASEWCCPSDMVEKQHKAGDIQKGCNHIKQSNAGEKRTCPFIDPANTTRCGADNHTGQQHIDFHKMMIDLNAYSCWPPAILQESFCKRLNR